MAKKAYWVTSYGSISNPQALAAYAKLAPPAIAPFGGRYLCAARPRPPTRPGSRSASSSPNSPAWNRRSRPTTAPPTSKHWEALGNGAERDIRIVEGLE